MTKFRLLILALGPIPIVATSLAVTSALRSERTLPPAANHFLVAEAQGDEPATTARRDLPARQRKRLSEDCRQTATQLRTQLGEKCQVIVRSPFVIGGDLSEDQLDEWHRNTIGPAARAMAQRYFRTPPNEPISVLLFSNESSYNQFADKLFGDRGVSIYGYYKPQSRTLVMNIDTGGGTLVHELTHALVDFDFPKIPDWFNEGLASLHEQCRFQEDESGPWIEGLENWRLPGLQKVARGGRLRSLQSLIGDDDFRGEQQGLNYAQARYFCLYLQREGRLEKFYQRFRATQADDPRGLQAVLDTVPAASWADLDRKFQDWVLKLEQP